MAEVFKAIKTGPDGFEKTIALKRILPFYTDHPQFIKMLSLEARIHSKLSHPNIIQLYDFFQWDQQYIIAMEYIDGCNAKQLNMSAQKKQFTLPWQACVFIASEVLKALQYAHKLKDDQGPLNIVHRDISPHNILIAYDGRVKLSDFGIANAQMKEDKTKSGILKGKYRYLSPEQVTAEDITPQSDLFSLGVTLYEMLAGTHPFSQNKEFELLKSIVRGDYQPLEEIRPDLPRELYAIVTQAMMPENQDRYSQARDFLDDLISIQEPRWLSYGEEDLSKVITQLIPFSDRKEVPIEKTKIMGDTTDGESFSISAQQSLIATTGSLDAFRSKTSSIQKLRQTRRKLSFGLIIGACLVAVYLFMQPQPQPEMNVIRQPKPIVDEIKIPEAAPTTDQSLINKATHDQNEPTVQENKTIPKPKPPLKKLFPQKTSKGTILFRGPHGTKVLVNGKLVGVLPIKQLNLEDGRYLMSFQYNQKTNHKQITVQAGKTQYVSSR